MLKPLSLKEMLMGEYIGISHILRGTRNLSY